MSDTDVTNIEIESNSQTKSEIDSNGHTESNSHTESQIESEIESDTKLETYNNLENNSGNNTETNTENNAENNTEQIDIDQTDDTYENSYFKYVDSNRYVRDTYKQFGVTKGDLRKFIKGKTDEEIENLILSVSAKKKADNMTNDDLKIMILSLLKNLYSVKKSCEDYEQMSEQYNVKHRIYSAQRSNNPSEDISKICSDVLMRIESQNTEDVQNTEELNNALCEILTPHGKKMELIKYKLLYYRYLRYELANCNTRLHAIFAT